MGSMPPRIRIDLKDLVIKPLDPRLDRAAFSCGDEGVESNKELSNYFRSHAADHHIKGWVRVYVGTYEGKIISYYWLSTQSYDPKKMTREDADKLGKIEFASCVYLGMLATQREYQGCGIGPTMMLHAFDQAIRANEYVGVYAITLQAVDRRTAEKYKSDFDFQYLDDEASLNADSKNIWMFLPLSTARKALKANGAA